MDLEVVLKDVREIRLLSKEDGLKSAELLEGIMTNICQSKNNVRVNMARRMSI